MSDIRDRIKLVCESGWPDIRRIAMTTARRGGLDALVEAYCLLCEAEARGKIPANDTSLESLHVQLSRCQHPLASMTARWNAIERGIATRHISASDLGGVSSGPGPPGVKVPDGPVPKYNVCDAAPAEATEAFSSILLRSNGKAAAIYLEIEIPVAATSGVCHALRAAFEPCGDAGFAEHVPASAPVHALLEIAINGGAYDDGMDAAHGRLAAWKTICWLVGSDSAAPHEQVLAEVETSEWIRFDALGKWFDTGPCIGCFACVNPTGTRVAAVAWTDSD